MHYIIFLAEAKFRESPNQYEQAIIEKASAQFYYVFRLNNAAVSLTNLICLQNIEKLMELVTNAETDEIKQHEENSTETLGLPNSALKLKLQLECQLFDKYMVPLTVKAQVQYLLAKAMDGNISSIGVHNIIRLKVTIILINVFPCPTNSLFDKWTACSPV